MGKAEHVTASRQKRKRDLCYILGGKCIICGYDKYVGALEFHHIDKSTKKYQLSSGNCHSWEEDINEVKKCALVCSNCHKELEIFDTPVFNSFDQERFEELEKEKIIQEHTCKECGVEITGVTYCAKCKSLMSRKVERPSREELKSLIRTETFVSIGKEYGVADNTIKKWCDFEKLPRTKREIVLISDDEWKDI